MEHLHCYGCAHADANAPPPGRPSGERPCCFCVRNPERERALEEHNASDAHQGDECKHPVHGFWYDGGSSVKTPMDNYITLDRLDQLRRTSGRD